MLQLTPMEFDIVKTVIVLLVFMLLRIVSIYLIKKYARKIERVEQRTGLIVKYINFITIFCIVLGVFLIWSVDLEHIESIFLSVFAVIGIGFFAQWSILSNITSGIIMFFIFPFKIGDYIKIHDKDNDYQGVVEDIKSFHLILRTTKGEMITYPNSLILQKGVSVVKPEEKELINLLKKEEDKIAE